jgi:hypothetical protein
VSFLGLLAIERAVRNDKRKLAELAATPGPLLLRQSGERFCALVGPDPIEPGKWRITEFSDGEVIGHATRDSYEVLVLGLKWFGVIVSSARRVTAATVDAEFAMMMLGGGR